METQRDFEEFREIKVGRGVMDLGEEGERDGVNLAMLGGGKQRDEAAVGGICDS